MDREESPTYLLDTSAMLALMDDEAGAGEVEKLLNQERVLIPWVALLEVHCVSTRRQGLAAADQRYGLWEKSGASILWENDERLVLQASRLKSSYDLYLADSLIAAHAIRRDSVLVHRDSDYRQLAAELKLVELPA